MWAFLNGDSYKTACAFKALYQSRNDYYLFIFVLYFLSSTCKGAGQWECTAQDCDGMYKVDP